MKELIEKVKATFLDEIYIQPQEETVYRIDQHGQRYYFKFDENGKPILKPSVTTIIQKYHPMSPYLLEWLVEKGEEESKEIQEETSKYGTFMHIIWAKLLLRNPIDLSESGLSNELYAYWIKENTSLFSYDKNQWFKNIRQDILGFIQWVQDYKINPIFIEMSIIGEKYSGTLDLGCQATYQIYNRSTKIYDEITKNILVDWKSGRKNFYEDNIIQGKGYLDLAAEKFPKIPFEEFWNYGCRDFRLPIGKTVIPYRFENQTNRPEMGRWKHYLAMYLEENPTIELETKFEIKETIVSIESNINDLIVEQNPLEFLEESDAGDNRTDQI